MSLVRGNKEPLLNLTYTIKWLLENIFRQIIILRQRTAKFWEIFQFLIFRTKNGEILKAYQNQNVLTIEKIDTSNIATYACNISNEFGYVYKVQSGLEIRTRNTECRPNTEHLKVCNCPVQNLRDRNHRCLVIAMLWFWPFENQTFPNYPHFEQNCG